MIVANSLKPHLIVATNGGPGSRAALRWAADLLQSHPADATLVTVESTPTPSAALHLENVENVLRAMAEESLVDGDARVGDPVDELIDAATSTGSELIVIGGRPGVGLAVHGSVHGRLAAVSPVPVAVIPAGWRREAGPITVGVNIDPASEDAIAYAVKLARRTGAELRFTYVWETPAAAAFAPGKGVDSIPDAARSDLEAMVAEVRRSDPDLNISLDLRAGDPVGALVDAGEEASVLVLGRRHHTAVGSVLGSLTARILAELPCPVILVPLAHHGLDVATGPDREEL